jgi:hypothetical protein
MHTPNQLFLRPSVKSALRSFSPKGDIALRSIRNLLRTVRASPDTPRAKPLQTHALRGCYAHSRGLIGCDAPCLKIQKKGQERPKPKVTESVSNRGNMLKNTLETLVNTRFFNYS